MNDSETGDLFHIKPFSFCCTATKGTVFFLLATLGKDWVQQDSKGGSSQSNNQSHLFVCRSFQRQKTTCCLKISGNIKTTAQL